MIRYKVNRSALFVLVNVYLALVSLGHARLPRV